MYGVDYAYSNDVNGIDTSAKIGSNYSSSYGVLAEDGFNTIVLYVPDVWYSMNTLSQQFTLIKNNNLKVIDHHVYFYKPNSSSSGGINQYNTLVQPTTAFVNIDSRYDQVYNNPAFANTIFGHSLGSELSYFHCYPFANIKPGNFDCNAAEWKPTEVPPQNLSDAISHFKEKRNSLGLTNQKIMFGAAVHGGTIENYHDGNGIYDEMNYVTMNGVSNPQKPDIFYESSYYSTDFGNWVTTSSSSSNYLGKFRSIDYAKSRANSIISEISIEQDDTNHPWYSYVFHSNQNILNANHLWFQAYNSIIYGADGILFWSLQESWKSSIPEDVQHKLDRNNPNKADRWAREYFPVWYKSYTSNLGKELSYLVKKDLLTTDRNSIIYSKTTGLDENCVLPPSTTYLPAYIYAPDSKDIYLLQNETPRTYGNFHRGEENGLQYTVRTNGSEVIMIVSNPNPYPISSVNLNFNNLSNVIIQNSTGVKVMFESQNPTYATVTSNSYKTNRNSNVDLTALTANSYQINFNGTDKKVSLAFGPFDVHVLKFVTGAIPNYNNGWDLIWTNNGNGDIGGWKGFKSQDKFIIGDFDGNGAQELLGIQTLSDNSSAWSTQLYYQNSNWNWGWSNYGNGFLGTDWQIRAADKFYAGNFDGIVGDELLCVQGDGPKFSMLKLVNGNWMTVWTTTGTNSNGTNSNIYLYRNNITIGDFDGHGKDQVLGMGDGALYMTMFTYIGGSDPWLWGWSNYGSSSSAIFPYRNNMRSGDFNGDDQTDILGINGSTATILYFIDGNWVTGESNNGGNFMGAWAFPPAATDFCLAGDVDTYDDKDEIFWIQGGQTAGWATTMNANAGNFTSGWMNNGLTIPYIDDWPVSDGAGGDTKYMLIRTSATSKKYLLAMRLFGCNSYLVNMYKTNSISNYRPGLDNKRDKITDNDVSVYPNPATNEFRIGYSLVEANGRVKIDLLNLFGQLVKSETFSVGIQGYNEQLFDVGSISNGIYILRVQREKQTFTKRIAIQK